MSSVGSSEDDQIDTEDEEETQAVQEEHEGIDFTKPWDHSDITFIVDDQKVYANKMILSMNSPVMKTMFESDFKEKNLEEIELPGKKLNTFVNLMKALHPPNKFIDAERLVPLAQEYQMTNLMSLCEKFLLQEPPSLSLLVTADKYKLIKLRKVCLEYAKKKPDVYVSWAKIYPQEFY